MRDGTECARCRFLGRLADIEDESLLEVGRDACETCVRLQDPHEVRIHHVHASLLYRLAQTVIERGGVDGCDLGKAVGIRSWAEQHLKFDDGLDPVDFDRLRRVGVAAECIHFGERIDTRRKSEAERAQEDALHLCRHPERDETTVRACYTCRDWTDAEDAPAPMLRATFRGRVRRTRRAVARWAVGVTTTRRYQPTLPFCLDSVQRAGWDEPRIFADSSVEIAARHRGLPLSLREPRLGAWPNYYLSLVELLMREPDCDAYMLLQDDVLLYERENLREYLEEKVLWPRADTGFVSLYCGRPYTRDAAGWYELGRHWVWGALAFIFPRESAKRLATDRRIFNHRWSQRNEGRANIDVVIGEWARRNRLKTFFPTPSLAQHIGESSTLWPSASARGSRRADRFLGDQVPRPASRPREVR